MTKCIFHIYSMSYISFYFFFFFPTGHVADLNGERLVVHSRRCRGLPCRLVTLNPIPFTTRTCVCSLSIAWTRSHGIRASGNPLTSHFYWLNTHDCRRMNTPHISNRFKSLQAVVSRTSSSLLFVQFSRGSLTLAFHKPAEARLCRSLLSL